MSIRNTGETLQGSILNLVELPGDTVIRRPARRGRTRLKEGECNIIAVYTVSGTPAGKESTARYRGPYTLVPQVHIAGYLPPGNRILILAELDKARL